MFKNWFYRPKELKESLSDEAYYESFGLRKKGVKYKIKDKEKLEYAYKKAWENRDFEINKFWSRAAYFWGFIVLTFGAYISDFTKQNRIEYIELYIVCMGLVFSVAWLFVIKGSKSWQENWEKHIDKLENYVSGPIYKIVYYKNTIYSVSKINEILSFSVILLWCGILFNYLYVNNFLPNNQNVEYEINYNVVIPLSITALIIYSIIFGYSSGDYKSENDTFIHR